MSRVVVVGAGPAGLAAARAAAGAGADVLLIDAGPKRGGQYARQDSLRDGDAHALPARVEHLPLTSVWAVEPNAVQPGAVQPGAVQSDAVQSGGVEAGAVQRGAREPGIAERSAREAGAVERGAVVRGVEPSGGVTRLHLLTGPADGPGRVGRTLDATALVLATGAYDLALPFPGWDLPGVYTAGAAQALAKGQRVAVGKRVVVSGTGPFLLPVARELLGVGAQVVGVLDANRPGWLRQPRGALAGAGKAGELAGYLGVLARHRVPYRFRRAVVAAHGRDRVEGVTVAALDADWNPLPGTARDVEVDAVCAGYGFVPQVELARSAGCALRGGFVVVDAAQRTSVPGVYAAGELTGIGGADLAAAEGEVAGLAAAGAADAPHRALRRVRALRRFAAALAAAHPVRPGWRTWLADDTLVCRCEEVTLAAVRAAATGSRALRLTSRAGLGLCQGRVCGPAVAELAGLPGDAFTRRPIATPIRLGELAEPHTQEQE